LGKTLLTTLHLKEGEDLSTIEEDVKSMKEHCMNRERAVEKQLAIGSQRMAEHENVIKNLTDWQQTQNGSLKHISDDMKSLRREINNIRTADLDELKKQISDVELEMVRGRPTWATLTIITFLSSALAGLLVHTF